MIVEGSAAVAVAAIAEHPHHFVGKHVGVVLTGGNIDWHRFLGIVSSPDDDGSDAGGTGDGSDASR
jgi:threonine dehydratase